MILQELHINDYRKTYFLTKISFPKIITITEQITASVIKPLPFSLASNLNSLFDLYFSEGEKAFYMILKIKTRGSHNHQKTDFGHLILAEVNRCR